MAVDRDSDGLTETCEELGVAAVSVLCDISTPEGVKAVMESAKAHWGRLDICVNNAAVAPHTALLNERVEVWDQVFAVNTRGTFLMTQGSRQGHDRIFRPELLGADPRVQPRTLPAGRPPRVSHEQRPSSWLPMEFWSTRFARDSSTLSPSRCPLR